MGRKGRIPAETLLGLRTRLANLSARDTQRRDEIERVAGLFGVSPATVYRQLQQLRRPQALRRSDRGRPRALTPEAMTQFCEIVAALKIRTENGKGRRLSTNRAIEILEEFGVETPEGHVQAAPGILRPATVNRWLRSWGLDHPRMSRAPAAVRFEARHSNECWQFDMSPSDLKHIDQPEWFDPGRGQPTLTLFSVVDDRSGVAYQEYRTIYGEDTESALRFLFNAMVPKEDGPLQGIPAMLYLDNGPVARSLVFQTMMERLGIDWRTHMPAGSDGNRTTARAKGKVERPFRTVKEAHETLYHFHKPATETEANVWLRNFVNRYNDKPHRREPVSRVEDWLSNLPDAGLREMCSWERYCTFAREPERRKVGSDARIAVGGAHYEVDADLAGEDVLLWWGLFDPDLFVEWNDRRYGPYRPSGGPIPLHRYRKRGKSAREKRAETVSALAEAISLPRSAIAGMSLPGHVAEIVALPRIGFDDPDPDPWHERAFATALDARRAISDQLRRPLGELGEVDLAFITGLIERTLDKSEIRTAIRDRFIKRPEG